MFGTDYVQFAKANRQLRENYECDPEFIMEFEKKLNEIAAQNYEDETSRTQFKKRVRAFLTGEDIGSAPYGFVWHHTEREGVLQLVEYKSHALTPHSGGKVLWGGSQKRPGNLTWKYVSPVTAVQIENVERQYDIKLPDDLKSLLLTANNGVPSMNRLNTLTGKAYWFGHLLSYREDNVRNIYDAVAMFDEEGMNEFFPIATEFNDNYICLEKESGLIVIWDRYERTVEDLAVSVTELLRMLRPDTKDEAES